MKSEATLEFINRIQVLITPKEFDQIKFELFKIHENYRKAFTNLIFAGYSIKIAFKNYKNLYEFAENNFIDYMLAIRLIASVAKESEEGLLIKDLTVYELN